MSSKKAAVKGKRYSAEEKQEIVDFVVSYNTENKRGGQSAAAKKYGVSQLTISGWLKNSGAKKATKKTTKAPKTAAAPGRGKKQAASSGRLDAKLAELLSLSKEIATLQAKFDSIKASL